MHPMKNNANCSYLESCIANSSGRGNRDVLGSFRLVLPYQRLSVVCGHLVHSALGEAQDKAS